MPIVKVGEGVLRYRCILMQTIKVKNRLSLFRTAAHLDTKSGPHVFDQDSGLCKIARVARFPNRVRGSWSYIQKVPNHINQIAHFVFERVRRGSRENEAFGAWNHLGCQRAHDLWRLPSEWFRRPNCSGYIRVEDIHSEYFEEAPILPDVYLFGVAPSLFFSPRKRVRPFCTPMLVPISMFIGPPPAEPVAPVVQSVTSKPCDRRDVDSNRRAVTPSGIFAHTMGNSEERLCLGFDFSTDE